MYQITFMHDGALHSFTGPSRATMEAVFHSLQRGTRARLWICLGKQRYSLLETRA